MATVNAESIDSLEELYTRFSGLHMEGGWHRKTPALWAEPRQNFLPYRWRYREVKPLLAAAGRLIDTEHAERRNLSMINPVEGNAYPTVRTLMSAYQLVLPGEIAYSHRHTPNALRLILEGSGTYTTVDGSEVEMRPGDVLLTPAMCWHSHENKGQEDCYWLDFLDVPLVHLLEPMFFQRHPDRLESDVTPVEVTPLAFRWENTQARLADAPATLDSHADVQLGNPALKTIALHMQRLDAGKPTTRCRTTANSLYAVLRGKGKTEIDGESFEWGFGDVIALPAWRPYQHNAHEDAVLLKVTDTPVFEALGWLRTEPA